MAEQICRIQSRHTHELCAEVAALPAEAWDEGLAASYVYPEPPNPYREEA